jgi:Peptidase S46
METNILTRRAVLSAVIVGACLVVTRALRADEGMWTFDNFPSKTVAVKYGFTPSQAWLDHVRAASLRIAGGCSASFISPQGLMMTNHHCASNNSPLRSKILWIPDSLQKQKPKSASARPSNSINWCRSGT